MRLFLLGRAGSRGSEDNLRRLHGTALKVPKRAVDEGIDPARLREIREAEERAIEAQKSFEIRKKLVGNAVEGVGPWMLCLTFLGVWFVWSFTIFVTA